MAVQNPPTTKIEYTPKEHYTAVRMTNDCMKGAGILTGSIMIVHFQREAEDGDIILFARKGKSYLRRVKYADGAVLLFAENPDYELMVLTDEDFVIGKVVEVKTYFDLGQTA